MLSAAHDILEPSVHGHAVRHLELKCFGKCMAKFTFKFIFCY